MKLRMGVKVLLIFLAMAIGGFDRHLTNYFPVEVKAMVQSDAIPMHSDLPVASCDYHEDITLKESFCAIPAPVVVSVDGFRLFHPPVHRVSPHTVWQPPEHLA